MSLVRLLGYLWSLVARIFWIGFVALLLVGSTIQLRDQSDQVRRFTRQIEFDYFDWTLHALRIKSEQFGIGTAGYLSENDRQKLVLQYFDLVQEARDFETQLSDVLADPTLADPGHAVAKIIAERDEIWERQSRLQPIVEAVLQEQVAFVLADLGLNFWGSAFPPVAFHFTRPPLALIVSPRHVIRQDANISIVADLPLEDQIGLEEAVEGELDISTLVEQVGGIGIYPTMVQESDSVAWIIETIVHEWVHNYLTLRPLGINYYSSPALRTMNETAASLLGREIGRKVLERYYPDFVPLPVADASPSPTSPNETPAFDFRAEMRLTRVAVDELLAQGRIEEAEAYMESRRQVFWENGYRIRRINQAYFAFRGAYADQPGGEAGEDPVGAGVRELWDRINSPIVFLRAISWMNDYTDLQAALAKFGNAP